MKTRVVVGMSGGVDSSVAAAMLQRQGYDVVGITLKMWPQDCASLIEDKCCGPQAMADARAVAAKLRIPHYVLDETREFERQVIDYFTTEYHAGRTPNPCVLCNERLKFGNLLGKAQGLGAEFVATGHYARIERSQDGSILRQAVHREKDQSYFLFTLGREQLAHILLPLGDRSKSEVRAIARELGLPVHDKDESQDICFVPENDYAAFLKTRLAQSEFQSGEIVDHDGRVLGSHAGIELFTIGQRRGINVGSPKPLYVLDIDADSRRVIVGDDADLLRDSLVAERCAWNPGRPPAGGARLTVRIRHNHAGAPASVQQLEGGRAEVKFDQPQRAISAGQAAVFYEHDTVVGGGWIVRERVTTREKRPVPASTL